VKIAVVGAGAIGGFLGARLAAAGEEVTFVARGPNLAAIQKSGLLLIEEDGKELRPTSARAYEKASDAGPQDTVLLTVKAHQVAAIAPSLEHLCHAETTIVTMQNGIPWWYFHRLSGPYEGRSVKSADPDGTIARSIDPNRIIGSVVYPATSLVAPGVVKVIEGNRFTVGELDGSTTSPRVHMIAASLSKAGFKVRIAHDLRSEIWLKLWGNLSFNPISALTHATLVDICQFPLTRDLTQKMMTEAEVIAKKLGVTFPLGIERRIAGAEKVGAHKTSMLQDIEQGRPIELEALVGAMVELGALTATPTPHIDAVYACTSLLARTLNSAHGRLTITSP
jgi:2-dehydropantoate 2-reductase